MDLLQRMLTHSHHLEFHASYSIKSVLPALVPHLVHEELAISDGALAPMAYAETILLEITFEGWCEISGYLQAGERLLATMTIPGCRQRYSALIVFVSASGSRYLVCRNRHGSTYQRERNPQGKHNYYLRTPSHGVLLSLGELYVTPVQTVCQHSMKAA